MRLQLKANCIFGWRVVRRDKLFLFEIREKGAAFMGLNTPSRSGLVLAALSALAVILPFASASAQVVGAPPAGYDTGGEPLSQLSLSAEPVGGAPPTGFDWGAVR